MKGDQVRAHQHDHRQQAHLAGDIAAEEAVLDDDKAGKDYRKIIFDDLFVKPPVGEAYPELDQLDVQRIGVVRQGGQVGQRPVREQDLDPVGIQRERVPGDNREDGPAQINEDQLRDNDHHEHPVDQIRRRAWHGRQGSDRVGRRAAADLKKNQPAQEDRQRRVECCRLPGDAQIAQQKHPQRDDGQAAGVGEAEFHRRPEACSSQDDPDQGVAQGPGKDKRPKDQLHARLLLFSDPQHAVRAEPVELEVVLKWSYVKRRHGIHDQAVAVFQRGLMTDVDRIKI